MCSKFIEYTLFYLGGDRPKLIFHRHDKSVDMVICLVKKKYTHTINSTFTKTIAGIEFLCTDTYRLVGVAGSLYEEEILHMLIYKHPELFL